MNDIKLINELLHEFTAVKSKNPNYSLRAFARDLDIPFSSFIQALRGKKGFSITMIIKCLVRLKYSEKAIIEILMSEVKNTSYQKYAKDLNLHNR